MYGSYESVFTQRLATISRLELFGILLELRENFTEFNIRSVHDDVHKCNCSTCVVCCLYVILLVELNAMSLDS